MHQQRQTGLRNVRQCGSQFPLRNHSEAFDAGMYQKALKPGDTRVCHRLDVVRIAGDNSAPRHPIHPATALCCCTFRIERADCRNRRQAV